MDKVTLLSALAAAAVGAAAFSAPSPTISIASTPEGDATDRQGRVVETSAADRPVERRPSGTAKVTEAFADRL